MFHYILSARSGPRPNAGRRRYRRNWLFSAALQNGRSLSDGCRASAAVRPSMGQREATASTAAVTVGRNEEGALVLGEPCDWTCWPVYISTSSGPCAVSAP